MFIELKPNGGCNHAKFELLTPFPETWILNFWGQALKVLCRCGCTQPMLGNWTPTGQLIPAKVSVLEARSAHALFAGSTWPVTCRLEQANALWIYVNNLTGWEYTEAYNFSFKWHHVDLGTKPTQKQTQRGGGKVSKYHQHFMLYIYHTYHVQENHNVKVFCHMWMGSVLLMTTWTDIFFFFFPSYRCPFFLN